MEQYIKKSTVKAEIEKRFDEYSSNILKHYDACKEAKAQELSKILTILDTLEVKEEVFDTNDIKDAFKSGYDMCVLQTTKKINSNIIKEVDLEKEIKNGIDNLSNLYCYMEDLFNGNEEEGVYPIPEKVKNELFEFAKYFFELGLKAQKEE